MSSLAWSLLIVQYRGETRVSAGPTCVTTGDQIVMMDESLTSTGLPLFPPLPASTDAKVVEKIRRILVVMGIGTTSAAQKSWSTGAGEVKYFRNLTIIGDDMISVFYCSQAIPKP